MRWAMVAGAGHAEIGSQDNTVLMACGEAFDGGIEFGNEDEQDAAVVTERPFGPDTCKACHAVVKGWVADPSKMPDGLFEAPVTPEQRRVMGAEARRAAVLGKSQPEGAEAPPRRPAVVPVAPEGIGDDLEFPDEPSSVPVVAAGALVVKPSRRRPAKSVVADEIEID